MVELMVAMVVASVVLTGIFSFAAVQRGIAGEHHREVSAQQDLDGAMWAMGRDIEQAGLGFARSCSEIRIWDGARNRLLNPGAIQSSDLLDKTPVDPLTKEPYWVLRDGLQAHWRSGQASSLTGSKLRSSHRSSAADSFDVILADGASAAASGVFYVDVSSWKDGSLSSSESAKLAMRSVDPSISVAEASGRLDSSKADDLSAVRQLFVPGSFVLVAAQKDDSFGAFRPQNQSQCILLQVTGNVAAGASADRWDLPIGNQSGFNASLRNLLGLASAGAKYAPKKLDEGGTGDFEPDSYDKAVVIPLGALRWSRYEIDYSVKGQPYLVRNDLIGWRQGEATFTSDGVVYPGCTNGECPAPTLRIPGGTNDQKPPRIAIGPMIEDMQVSVGCDGYSQASVDAKATELGSVTHPHMLPGPDVGFAETDGMSSAANLRVDEAKLFDDRDSDEWLGNAVQEQWGPDCVFYGTAQAYADKWPTARAMEGKKGPAFRMSPQTMRVSLVARQGAKGAASPGGRAASGKLEALEDREETTAFAQGFGTQTRTERFSPRNLRWRDPSFP